MRKFGLILLVLFVAAIHHVAAQGVSISYQLSPEILLPGDYADCILVISNPSTSGTSIKVNSVILTGYGVEIAPREIYSIGIIPAGGSATLPFSIKAIKAGRFNVEASISTENGTIRQNIQIVVDDNFPSLTVTSPVYKGEVNDLQFYVSSPTELKDVRVEALFNATPQSVYLGEVGSNGAEGVFKFFPSSSTLEFRISFYNGNNYHEVIRTVNVRMLESKGVVVNVTVPYKTLYIGDSILVPVEVANLRGDEIIGVRITAQSDLGTFSDPVEVPSIPSGESKRVNFKFSPARGGEGEVFFTIEYSDEFGNKYSIEKSFSIKVLDSFAVSLTNVNVAREGMQVTVSGDVSNNGRSEVYNAYALATCDGYKADYFIGNIDPSDFQSFDLPVKCNKSVLVTVSWSNDLGEKFEIHKQVNLGGGVPTEVESSNLPIVISIVVAAVVFVIIGLIIYRQIRK
ncbi:MULTISPECIES: hypothetical protein [unclassified Archaeoglobus]|mgnify:CR=1 FL=1|jgi:hypothetical protein|uniref:hypothetical protein n=1 Tax=unclassified Archaeoglobus TaxID=2643606 RepID=UPI0025C6646F|nr:MULTISPECIES: hypothetical protein [unclassified Archaeoglobus]